MKNEDLLVDYKQLRKLDFRGCWIVNDFSEVMKCNVVGVRLSLNPMTNTFEITGLDLITHAAFKHGFRYSAIKNKDPKEVFFTREEVFRYRAKHVFMRGTKIMEGLPAAERTIYYTKLRFKVQDLEDECRYAYGEC